MELLPKDIMCLSLIQEQLDIKTDALTLPLCINPENRICKPQAGIF